MALSKLAKGRGACMADGGIVQKENPEQLMARMAAKYGVKSGQSEPNQLPAQQQPEQLSNRPQGIVPLLANRQKQLDQQEKKIVGYANGGIVARAFKFKGKGGPTDDEIPVKVAGQSINVSNGEKAVVLPAKTAQNPQAVSAIENIIEQTNGNPVGPTIKGGKMAAENGAKIDPNLDPFAYRGGKSLSQQSNKNGPDSTALDSPDANTKIKTISQLNPLNFSGRASDRLDDNRSELNTTGNDTHEQLNKTSIQRPEINIPVADQNTASAPQSDINKSAFADTKAGIARRALMPAGSMSADGKTDISGKPLITNVGGDGTQGMSAKDSVSPASSQPLNVSMPSTIGPSLSQRALGTTSDNISQMENIQKANSLMTPQGGVSFLADPNNTEASNAEKSARWRQDDMISTMKGMSGRGAKGALSQALTAQISGQNALASEAMRQQIAQDGLALNAANNSATQGLAKRAQDQAAARESERNRLEEMRLAGNPLDNQEKQIGIGQKSRLAALQEQAINGKTEAEKQAARQSLAALSGRPEAQYKALTVGGGKNSAGDVMPERVVVVDERTGASRFVDQQGQQTQAQKTPQEYLKAARAIPENNKFTDEQILSHYNKNYAGA